MIHPVRTGCTGKRCQSVGRKFAGPREGAALSDEQNRIDTARRRVLTGRRLIACAQCGWVHYAMNAEEKIAADTQICELVQRYQMSEEERGLLEAALSQCLRCESPAKSFRAAAPEDVAHAEGHTVTPIYVEFDLRG